MKERKIKEKEASAIGIRNIADIRQKWEDMRSISDITELYKIAIQESLLTIYKKAK